MLCFSTFGTGEGFGIGADFDGKDKWEGAE